MTLYRVWKGYSSICSGDRREICRIKAGTIEQIEKFIEEELFASLEGIHKDTGTELPSWFWYENENGLIVNWSEEDRENPSTRYYVEVEKAPAGTKESFTLITGENYYYDLAGQEVSH